MSHSQPLLVLDSHYLCHRAFHTMGGLSHQAKATGVIFGFLKSIQFLKDEFQTDQIAFCFEHSHLFRRDIYPEYKRKRFTKERSSEEKKALDGFRLQISELRQRYLPKIGFKNVFRYHGFEADDIMAAIALNYPGDVILVTSDQDMFQCLSENVDIYSPQKRKLLTEAWFRREYKIEPRQWAKVKALAGCDGDNVKGIKGIGERFALKFVQGALDSKSHAFALITNKNGVAVARRNKELVSLPYSGCPIPVIQEDSISKENWLMVASELGFGSLAARPPVAFKNANKCSQMDLPL